MALSNPVPQHIAIIMDGNGRWAKLRGLPRNAGHKAGAESFRNIANYCRSIGVKYLTVYAFSTENWKRSQEEVGGIMLLLGAYLREALRDMEKNHVRFCFFGDLSRLNPELRKLCQDAQNRSSEYDEVQVNFCLNYGGRAELVRATKSIVEAVQAGKLSLENVNEQTISDHLYTTGQPDVDLMIRTSGEMRLSNFLLWQCAYAEFLFPTVLWPDFTVQHYDEALLAYGGRERRFGGRLSK